MSRKLDLSQFRGDSPEPDDELRVSQLANCYLHELTTRQKELELTDLKKSVFSRGVTKKTRKDLEKEAEEKKRVEEEKSAVLVVGAWP